MFNPCPNSHNRRTSILPLFPEGTRTLSDIETNIRNNAGISSTRKRDLLSALRVISTVLQASTDQIPAKTEWLRARLGKIEPAALGLSKKTWSNILSNAKAALMCESVKVGHKRTFGPAWQVLWDRLHSNQKISLTRFMSFCSTQGINPPVVSDATMADFAILLRQSELRKNPDLALYYLAAGWNKAVERVAGWPAQRLTVPRRRVIFKISPDQLPLSFRQDLTHYRAVMSCADPLQEIGPTKPLSPASLASYERQVLRFAGELIQCGLQPNAITSLAVMVRPENCEMGLRAMLARRENKTSMTIYGMISMLKTIAKHYVRLPATEVVKLTNMSRKLKVRHEGMTEKNRGRLRQFDDPKHAARLLHLPAELVADAQHYLKSSAPCWSRWPLRSNFC